MLLYNCSKGTKRKEQNVFAVARRQKGRIIMSEKFCVKCGKKFVATGREVICPSCREAAKAEAKKAAVLKAKKASWSGESVPVRISGRASTIIRRYGAANNMPFAAALDDLLRASDYFKGVGVAWEEVEPYKSHRRDKNTATSTPQDAQDAPQEAQAAGKPQEVKQAARKTTTSKAGKAAGKAGKKA